MTIRIMTVGKKSSRPMLELCNEYQKRLQGKIEIEWQYVDPTSGRMGRAEQKERESQTIIDKLPQNCYVVLLDESGISVNNQQLATRVQDWKQQQSPIYIVIGGAFGVSDKLMSRVDWTWSLSKLVFPHEIVRLVLIEQLYRSQTIIDGQPYHHE